MLVSGYIDQKKFEEKYRPSVSNAKIKIEIDKWQPFLISDLFDITTGKDFIYSKSFGDTYPVIGQKSINNGIACRTIELDDYILQDHNTTLSLAHIGNFCSFVQEEDFYLGTRTKALKLRYDKANRYILSFLSTIINYESFRYNYGRVGSDKFDKTYIKLPVLRDMHDKPVLDNKNHFQKKGLFLIGSIWKNILNHYHIVRHCKNKFKLLYFEKMNYILKNYNFKNARRLTMNKYLFGFDIGCASVGWAVIDSETGDVINLGSNIFSEANPEENLTRRQRRGQRRLLRRRKNRIRDFKVNIWNKFVEPKLGNNKYGEIIDYLNKKYNKPIVNIVQLKVKGLSEKLSQEEIYYILLNYCKHKGISYLDEEMNKSEDEDSNKKLSEYAKGLKLNQEKLEKLLPCQIQFERLNKNGCYRGENNIFDENNEMITLSNVFTTSSYIKEIKSILDIQKEYYDFITEEFQNEFIELFKRKREYYVGPGNEKSRTDYGRFTTKIGKDGNYIDERNIFSKLVGKCSVFNKQNGYENEEFRASTSSYSAEYYNLLNDLNNIKIGGEKLTKEEREKVINLVKNAERLGDKDMEKIFREVTGKKDGIISGARVDRDGNNIYHKFECYRKIKKYFNQNDINVEDIDKKKYNKIMDILTINTEKDAIKIGLENSEGLRTKEEDGIVLDLNEQMIELLCKFRNTHNLLFSKWHSFSYKIIDQLIPMMLETGKEQMQCLLDLKVIKENKSKLSDKAILSKKLITQEIYNPVVIRATRVSVDILNALIKKYGFPEKVVVEMPRDKNETEEKKRIKNEQSKNEKELANVLKIINNDYGVKIEIGDKYFKAQKNLAIKLKLWEEQQHRCVYSGKIIEIYDLLNNYDMFEIDHIIPLSLSYDDSRQNKVLVYRTENQLKGQNTPLGYIKSGEAKVGLDQFTKMVKEIYGGKKEFKRKLQNLLSEEDITKKVIRDSFVERNLNDTRYASRTFLNAIQNYFDRKDEFTKVNVIKGSFTHQMRVGLGLQKDRDESFSHHAIDAALICYAQMGYDTYIDLQKPYIDEETGEIINIEEYNKKMTDEVYKDVLYQKKWKKIKDNLLNAESNVKYWYKPDRKANRKISDETIYGTRTIDDKIYKINYFDIRANDGGEKFKKYKDKLLMRLYDKKTFEYLEKIYTEYDDEKNPFVAYEKDTGSKIRKYAKNGKGAIISKLKYLDGELGKCIDISNKYGFEKGSRRVILAQLVPFRTDVYYNVKTKKYKFVGVKQNTLKYIKGKLEIDILAYENLLKECRILNESEKISDLTKGVWKFRLSFYDNEYMHYEKENSKMKKNDVFEERHHSLSRPNVIETKPIKMSKFIGKARNFSTVTNVVSVQKIISNILGEWTYISEEKFSLKI